MYLGIHGEKYARTIPRIAAWPNPRYGGIGSFYEVPNVRGIECGIECGRVFVLND